MLGLRSFGGGVLTAFLLLAHQAKSVTVVVRVAERVHRPSA